MSRDDARRSDQDPRWLVFIKRAGIVAASAASIIGFYKAYLLEPLEAFFHHFFKTGGGPKS